jgi:hypothetical protein
MATASMDRQLPLFDAPPSRKLTLEERFERFHADNPHVYRLLQDMALQLKRAGHDHWGIRNLWERLRYDLAVKTTDHSPRLNDNLTPFYSRKLMAEVAELEGFFETRGDL